MELASDSSSSSSSLEKSSFDWIDDFLIAARAADLLGNSATSAKILNYD